MKRIGITIALSTLLYLFVSSQTYYPFPELDTYWRYSSHDIPMICGCWGVCSEKQHKITGDTLINGIFYHKIEHSGYWINDNCDENFFSFGYQGAFRNDI